MGATPEPGESTLIHRSRLEERFTTLPNLLLQDAALGYCDRGVMAEILSRPPGWKISADQMADSQDHDGRTRIRASFQRLRKRGYLHRINRRHAGRFVAETHAYLTPTDNCQAPGCQDCKQQPDQQELDITPGRTDIPETVCGVTWENNVSAGHTADRKPPTVNGTCNKEQRERTERSKHSLAAAFETFWSVYPRKVGKPKAQAAYTRAITRATADQIIHAAKRLRDQPGREDKYTPHPTTWLNRDGWNDDITPARTTTYDPYADVRMPWEGQPYD